MIFTAAEISFTLGLIPAVFINADGGATYPPASVTSETPKARPGDFILAHGPPESGTAPGPSAATLPCWKRNTLRLDRGENPCDVR